MVETAFQARVLKIQSTGCIRKTERISPKLKLKREQREWGETQVRQVDNIK